MAEAVKPIIMDDDITMPIAALKFILMNLDVASVIPGSAKPERVKSNAKVAKAKPLSEKAMKALKELWMKRTIHRMYNGS